MCIRTLTAVALYLLSGYCDAVKEGIIMARQGSQYRCITKSSNALSWTEETITRSLQKASEIHPKPEYISDDIWETGGWDSKYSVNGPIQNPIFDRRWEKLTEYETRSTQPPSQLQFQRVEAFELPPHFNLPISLRVSNEAHIFLCNGTDIKKAGCYWIILGGWNGRDTVLRKCTEYNVPYFLDSPAQGSCDTKLKKISHTGDNSTPLFLSKSLWVHLYLQREGRKISISLITERGRPNTILEFEDTQQIDNMSHLFFNSRDRSGNGGFWRPHYYKYRYTREIKDMQIGNLFPISNQKTICISLFAIMCNGCRIEVTITDKIGSNRRKLRPIKSTFWKEHKLIFRNISFDPIRIKLLTLADNGIQDQFWAVNEFRLCDEDEFRYIRSEIRTGTPKMCQLISEDSNLIEWGNKIESVAINDCPTTTIGSSCIPCIDLFPNCEKIKICEKSSKFSQTKCFCSSGYSEIDCNSFCPSGHYGFGCAKKCDKCIYNSCQHHDGVCKYGGCVEKYTGPKCDIPPGIRFKYPPEIEKTNFTGFLVKVKNFELNPHEEDSPQSYSFQYKKTGEEEWQNVYPADIVFGRTEHCNINGLKSDTTYEIRAVITSKSNNYYNDADVPVVKAKTTCKDIEEKNLLIVPTNTTVEISFQGLEDNNCKVEKYIISLNSSLEDYGSQSLQHEKAIFRNLRPYSNYTIRITEIDFEKAITTLEGAPEAVVQLRVCNASATSLTLMWDPPETPNGPVNYYTVEIQHVRYLACDSEYNNGTEMRSIREYNTETIVTGLIPYSEYNVTVYAENSCKGKPSSVSENTLESDFVSESEIPQQQQQVSVENESLTMFFHPVKCTDIRGQLFLIMNLSCADITQDWHCRPRITSFRNNFTENSEFSLNALSPFTKYDLNITVCRSSRENCKATLTYAVQTKPTVPNEVTELEVYSKENNSVSLRWKPPYPPTGILVGYVIQTCNYYRNCSSPKKLSIPAQVPCKIWPGYLCTKLEKLQPNVNYYITLQAQNGNVSTLGKEAGIYCVTGRGKPDSPEILKIEWFPNNDLGITWKHPNKTNGELDRFEIVLTPEDKHKQGVLAEKASRITENYAVSEKVYNLTYFLKISANKISPSTTYKIVVYSFNGFKSVWNHTTIETSPPEIPSFENNPEMTSSNNSINVMINIKPPKNVHTCDLSIFVDGNDIIKCNLLEGNYKMSLIIGGSELPDGCSQMFNVTLESGTDYNVTLVINNTFASKSRQAIFSKRYSTRGEPPKQEAPNSEGSGGVFALLLLLLLAVPPLIYLYMKRKTLLVMCRSWIRGRNYGDGDMPLVSNSNVHQEPRVANLRIYPKQGDEKNIQKYSQRIAIMDFEHYVKESLDNGELKRQHELFPRGQTRPWKVGSSVVNKTKNRYNNLVAYDHSRVILREINGDPNSTYINANYIDGYKIPKAFIGTQGPKATTLNDFWRMVWEQNVRNIIMVANIYESGKKKVEKYWPDPNAEMVFNKVIVQFVSEDVFADYIHRIFEAKCGEEIRRIEHLHFNSWPDHGVPLYSQSLVPFLRQMLKIPLSSKSPVVVHCSAGVGRTGTILLCEITLRMAAAESAVDLLKVLSNLRNRRPNMVDNIHQYILAHLVVLECLFKKDTSIPCTQLDEFVKLSLVEDLALSEMRYLEDTAWEDHAMKNLEHYDDVQNEYNFFASKNRRQDILPEPQGRVYITRYPQDDKTSSYINAVKVDGFRNPGHFIVTQNPMPNTLGDFWRMIDEHNVDLIISLNEIDLQEPNSCYFWPDEPQSVMQPVDYITLRYQNKRSSTYCDFICVLLRKEGNDDKNVQILSLKGWKCGSKIPKNIENFLDSWEEYDYLSRGNTSSIVVTCRDGVTSSGLFVAFCFLVEKMKLEKVYDVCTAVRTVRQNRGQFVQDLQQFLFLYRIGAEIVNNFSSYANFQSNK